MAPFTPYAQGIVGQFDKQSKEYDPVRPDLTMGKLLTGVGEALTQGLQGWDKLQEYQTQNTQFDFIKSTVDKNTQEGLEYLTRTGQTPPSAPQAPVGADVGVPAPAATPPVPQMEPTPQVPYLSPTMGYTDAPELEGTATASTPTATTINPVETDPNAVNTGPEPIAVTQGLAHLRRLGQAIKLTNNIGLYSDIHAKVQELISQYPNRRVQISDQAKHILGTDAGLGLRNAVQNLIAQQLNEANTNTKAWDSYVNSHAKYFIQNGAFNEALYKKALGAANDPNAQNEVRTYISRVQSLEHASDFATKKFNQTVSQSKATNVDGVQYAHEQYSGAQAKIFTDATFSMGDATFNWQTLQRTAQALQASGKPVDREKMAQLAMVAQRFIDDFNRRADEIDNAAQHGPNRQSLRALTDPKDLREARNQYLRIFEEVRDQFGKENGILATSIMNTAAGAKDSAYLQSLAHPIINQWVSATAALPGEAQAVMINNMMMRNNFAGFNQLTRDLSTVQQLSVPSRPPNSPPQSMRDFLNQYNILNPLPPGPTSPRSETQRTNFINYTLDAVKAGLSAANIPDVETRTKYAEVITNPETGKFITDFKKDQQHIVWGRIADPDVSKNMKEIGGSVWTNYRDWNTEVFKQLYNTNFSDIASAAQDPRLNLRLDPTGTKLIYDTPQAEPTRTLRRPMGTTLPPETKDIQAVERFNAGLAIYNNVLKQDGETATPQMLNNLGIPLRELPKQEGQTGQPTYVLDTGPADWHRTVGTGGATGGITQPFVQQASLQSPELANIQNLAQAGAGTEAPPRTAQQAIAGAVNTAGIVPMRGQRLPPAIRSKVLAFAEQAGLPEGFLDSVIDIESSGDPNRIKGSYKGLGQLSDAQFRKYGRKGGNIFNADDNLEATTNKFVDMANRFENKYGRRPTHTELYIAHQQGEGGLAKHMANPQGLAWQNMASTAEGRRKGEAWAKRAIWGNVPDDVKSQYNLNTLTSEQFMGLWGRKLMGGPMRRQQRSDLEGSEGDILPSNARLTQGEIPEDLRGTIESLPEEELQTYENHLSTIGNTFEERWEGIKGLDTQGKQKFKESLGEILFGPGRHKTWPERLWEDIGHAIDLPGDVASGKIKPGTPEYYERATTLAGLTVLPGRASVTAGRVAGAPQPRLPTAASEEAPGSITRQGLTVYDRELGRMPSGRLGQVPEEMSRGRGTTIGRPATLEEARQQDIVRSAEVAQTRTDRARATDRQLAQDYFDGVLENPTRAQWTRINREMARRAQERETQTPLQRETDVMNAGEVPAAVQQDIQQQFRQLQQATPQAQIPGNRISPEAQTFLRAMDEAVTFPQTQQPRGATRESVSTPQAQQMFDDLAALRANAEPMRNVTPPRRIPETPRDISDLQHYSRLDSRYRANDNLSATEMQTYNRLERQLTRQGFIAPVDSFERMQSRAISRRAMEVAQRRDIEPPVDLLRKTNQPTQFKDMKLQKFEQHDANGIPREVFELTYTTKNDKAGVVIFEQRANGKDLWIKWAGGRATEGNKPIGIWELGAPGLEIGRHIAKEFPNADRIGGYRISGIRSKLGAKSRVQWRTLDVFRD